MHNTHLAIDTGSAMFWFDQVLDASLAIEALDEQAASAAPVLRGFTYAAIHCALVDAARDAWSNFQRY